MTTNFNCNVRIVDAMMGCGKTSAAINYINSTGDEKRFLYITPYLDEVERIKEACPGKKFKEPHNVKSKLNSIKYLIGRGDNIVSTHALFQKFDRELIDICRAKNYTLIMDEVADVIEKYDISDEDFDVLKKDFVDIDENTGRITWRNTHSNYTGKFSEEKRLCDLNCLAYYGGSVMMWLFPVEVFDAFRDIYILTYMFKSQVQRYYYDFYGLPYTYLYVTGNDYTDFHFTENPDEKKKIDYDFKNLIHILEDDKLNLLGDTEYALSKNWYVRNKDNAAMKQLKHNIENYFRNKRNTKTSENLWTTFKDIKMSLSGKGYGRAFAPLNMRASNNYRDRISVVYPVNRFLNTGIKQFFLQHGTSVDEDGFALSEMLQFIWRSAIRDGNEIWVYIPSIRMRNLFTEWINMN